MYKKLTVGLLATLVSVSAFAGSYTLDPSHTYPSFEADHMGGLSKWRGKINKSSGTLEFDEKAQTGSVKVTMDMSSIDFGMDKMNDHAKSPDIFDVEMFPTATYESSKFVFTKGKLTAIEGNLTLKDVTKPVTLTVHEYLCKPHPMLKKEACGADASATINRADFGVDYGMAYGFKPEVKLQIQVEGIRN